jgi:hypothetical protein
MCVEATIEKRDYGRKKKNRGDEPIWAIVYIYMEMTQRNFLCIILTVYSLCALTS